MADAEDILIGKIAIQMGLLAPGQLDQFLQLSRESGKPVSALLLAHRVVSPEDHQKLHELRNLNLHSEEAATLPRHEAILFARQVAREGLVAEDVLNECLRDFAIEGEVRSLDDLLVERGLITREKARELVGLRQKRHMHCPRCKVQFAVRSASGRKVVECPRCKQPLEEYRPKATATPGEVVEFKTTILKRSEMQEMPPPASPAPGTLHLKCIICDTAFGGVPDATGRVKCPSCGSNFTPR